MLKRLEHANKRLLLKLLLASRPKPAVPTGPLPPKPRILFIRLNNIGDALVTTPLIHAVKQQLNAEVHVLAVPHNQVVFRKHPDVDALHIFRKGLGGFRDYLKLCRTHAFDAVVDLHDDISTTVTWLMALANAPRRIGLARDGSEAVLTHSVPRPDPAETHVIQRHLALAPLLGVQVKAEDVNVFYPLQPESAAVAKAFVAQHFQPGQPLLLVNLSAGSDARWWGVERWQEAIRAMQQHPHLAGWALAIVCAPADLPRAQAIVAATDLAHISIYCQKNYNAFAAILSEARLLVTPDTAIVHLASAIGLPLFGLYVSIRSPRHIWYPWQTPYEAFLTYDDTLETIDFAQVKPSLEHFLTHFAQPRV